MSLKILCFLMFLLLAFPLPCTAAEGIPEEEVSGHAAPEDEELAAASAEPVMPEEPAFMPEPFILEEDRGRGEEDLQEASVADADNCPDREEKEEEEGEGEAAFITKLPEMSAVPLTEGSCGEGVSFRYRSGTLTISSDGGAGLMKDYSRVTELPWYQYKDSVKEVVVGDGVVRIGNYAFTRCRYLTSVKLPASLKQIGVKAFAYCDSLKDILLPDIEKLFIDAGNSELKNAYDRGCSLVPDSKGGDTSWKADGTVLYITGKGAMDDYRFQEAPWYRIRNRIEKVIIKNGVTHIGAYAFANLTAVKTFEIPASVASIGARAFYKNISLTEVSLPEGLSDLGPMAFQDCSSLRKMAIPQNVTSINEYVFCGCSSLKEVSIGASALRILRCAFYGTGPLSISYGGTKDSWQKMALAAGNSTVKQAKMNFATKEDLREIMEKRAEELAVAAIKGMQFIECADEITLRPWSSPVNLKTSVTGNGKVTYLSRDILVAKVNSKGKVTPINTGFTSLTVKADETDDYMGSKRTVNVVVRGPAGTRIRSAIKKGRSVTVKYRPRYTYSGYQLEYSKTPDFKVGRVLTIGVPSQDTFTFSVPSSGTWYIRMKTIKRYNGRDFHSDWCEAVRV